VNSWQLPHVEGKKRSKQMASQTTALGKLKELKQMDDAPPGFSGEH
jgi:hypothetical protein